MKENWETLTVIDCLLSDDYCHKELLNKEAHQIRRFVCEDRRAPAELYTSFKKRGEQQETKFAHVDWYTVQAVFDPNLRGEEEEEDGETDYADDREVKRDFDRFQYE